MVKGSQSQASTLGGGAKPATAVGGSRTTLARRNVGKSSSTQVAPTSRGPRSTTAAGGQILRFYTDDAPGLKIGPTTVLVLSLVFMAIVVVLHIVSKFRAKMD
eukprot:Platyproteum_vivax@DN4714_c0_g1_i1.p1